MARREALSADELAQLVRLKQAGGTHRATAQALGCAVETVRQKWRAHRRGQAPRPRGRPARGLLSTFDPRLAAAALALKRAHPHWGPARVRLALPPAAAVPSRARLAELFRADCPEAVQPHQRAVFVQRAPRPVRQPHERWQLDAKESVRVRDGSQVTVLEARDPACGLMIASQVWPTPPRAGGGCRKLTLAETQATLRRAFCEWGRPGTIQTDHEGVYLGALGTDFPTPFTLWLAGLDIAHCPSRRRCPTDQAQVERQHRTCGDWVWKDDPGQTPADLQARLDAQRAWYHTHFPTCARGCHGQPPLLAHPAAQFSGRPYDPASEAQLLDLGRVAAFLVGRCWRRKVSSTGTVCLGDHLYSVGRAHAGHHLSITFQADCFTFRFAQPSGERLADLPAQGLSVPELLGPASGDLPPIPARQLPLPLAGGV